MRKTILIIEDDQDDFVLLRTQLNKIAEDYQLEWISNYADGLKAVLGNNYELVFIDYQLGSHNGIDLLKEARRKGTTLPIVLLTGLNESLIDVEALKSGADDYLSKDQIHTNLLDRSIRYSIERRKAYLEREKLLREQIASREMSKRKDEFMGIVSHELKTPVTSLKAFGQVLHNRFFKSGDMESASLLQKMDDQINKLASLIEDLLDITKIEKGKLQFHEDVFEFDMVVSTIIEEVQRTTSKHTISLINKINKKVYGDQDRIGQVITNLLTNAIKYSPDANQINVVLSSDEKCITCAIQDFGIGIPKEKQPYVFDRFFRVDEPHLESFSGIGLGLYISCEIIKRQHGQIWLESVEGKGSTFYFKLPVYTQPH